MIIFYDHLLDLETLDQELSAYLPDAQERAEIVSIMDASLHHAVMDVIFTSLPTDAHELFLMQFHADPGAPEHFDLLRRYRPLIEDDIRSTAHTTKRQFLDTIHAD